VAKLIIKSILLGPFAGPRPILAGKTHAPRGLALVAGGTGGMAMLSLLAGAGLFLNGLSTLR
jgi:hypothetical protein